MNPKLIKQERESARELQGKLNRMKAQAAEAEAGRQIATERVKVLVAERDQHATRASAAEQQRDAKDQEIAALRLENEQLRARPGGMTRVSE